MAIVIIELIGALIKGVIYVVERYNLGRQDGGKDTGVHNLGSDHNDK